MRNVVIFVLACSLLSAHGQTFASATKGHRVEFPVWDRVYSGTLGTKQISVSLTRIADNVSGSYCYEPCSNARRQQLQLAGSVKGDTLELTERDTQSAKGNATGHWALRLDSAKAAGTWTSPDRKKSFPMQLRDVQPVPFELGLVADALPGRTDECDEPPHVLAVRVYRQGRVVQELSTDSQGTCQVFTPSFVDANFDGYPDLTLALTLPAGPNIPHQTWLYDPGTRRFVDGPDALQDITSPEFDKPSKTIVSRWRNGCCEHGVTAYRWHGNQLDKIASAASVQLPVLVGHKILHCYTVPDYQDGHIEYPDRVEQVGNRLTLTFDDFSGCEAEGMPASSNEIAIWKRDAAGKLKVVRTESMAWRPVETPAGRRYCPEIPYFANGRIERKVLRDDPEETCSETAP